VKRLMQVAATAPANFAAGAVFLISELLKVDAQILVAGCSFCPCRYPDCQADPTQGPTVSLTWTEPVLQSRQPLQDRCGHPHFANSQIQLLKRLVWDDE
jgi:hypothetical protein